MARLVTNVRKGRHTKSIWFEDTARERTEIVAGQEVPNRYGPDREYVANCFTVENADRIVAVWNAKL